MKNVARPLFCPRLFPREPVCERGVEGSGMKRWFSFLFTEFFLISLLKIGNAMADTPQSPDELLSHIVERTVEIVRSHGYPIPRYVVRNGGTDLPVSEVPTSVDFFASTEKSRSWVGGDPWSFRLQIFDARKIPVRARSDLVKYLIELHEARGGDFEMSLRMMNRNYKKGALTQAPVFLEVQLKKIHP